MRARLEQSAQAENKLRMQELAEKEIVQADVKEATEAGIIEFPKEKREPDAGRQKKELRLEIKPDLNRMVDEGDDDDFVEIPAPLVDKHSINLKRRKRGKEREVTEEEAKFNKKFKKIKVARDQAIKAEKLDNQFGSLGVGEDSSGEEEGNRRVPLKKTYKQDANRMKGKSLSGWVLN